MNLWNELSKETPNDCQVVVVTDGHIIAAATFYEDDHFSSESWDPILGEYSWYVRDINGNEMRVKYWLEIPERT